jgi:hypothetical protein
MSNSRSCFRGELVHVIWSEISQHKFRKLRIVLSMNLL